MKRNEGKIDRLVRTIAGAALIAWPLLYEGPAWAYVGFIPLITGIVGTCPLYTFLGINTCGHYSK